MENIESAATAAANDMVVDESADQEQTDVIAEQLIQEVAQAGQAAAAEDADAANAGGQAAVEGEDGREAGQQEQTPEQVFETNVRTGVQQLFERGWSVERLTEMSRDEQVHADLAAGCSIELAAALYLNRRLEAQQPAEQHAGKRGVPVTRIGATAGAAPKKSIEDMSDEEFDAFSRRAKDLAREGKRVKM